QPGGGRAGQEAGERADARAASGRQGVDLGQEGALRPLRAARQDGRQPAARGGDGGYFARRGGKAARREGQAVEAEGRGAAEGRLRKADTGRQVRAQGGGETGAR